MPSAILGVLAVWLIYLVGKEICNRWVWTARRGPSDSVAVPHLVLDRGAHVRVDGGNGTAFPPVCPQKFLDKPSWRWGCGISISGALFLYSHFYALLGFAGVGLICASYAIRDLLRARTPLTSSPFLVSIAMGLGGLLFLPWLVVLAIRVRSVAESGFWIAYPDVQFLESLVFGITGSLPLFWLLTTLAAVATVGSFLPISNVDSTKDNTKQALMICLGFTAMPVLLAYLYSVLVQPILFDRYLIAAWPGLLLLSAYGATILAGRYGAFLLLPAAIYLSFSNLQFTLFEKVRPEWRVVAEHYRNNAEPNDRLFLYKGFAEPALAYYLRQPYAFTPIESLSEQASQKARTDAPTDWLMIVHTNQDEFNQALKAFGATSETPATRAFGWGASGLTLVKKPSGRSIDDE